MATLTSTSVLACLLVLRFWKARAIAYVKSTTRFMA
jgi:hypothetical protein